MKLTAEQARIYLKNLPFILVKYVPVDDLYYQLLLQIILIVQICFSPVASAPGVDELREAVELHLTNFKELFPTINIIPKMHYLIHIPDQILHLGPLVRHSCMRFEARHAYFKDIAPLQNFKNICLSLAERYQLDDCANLCNDNPNHHPLFQTEKKHGPTKKLEGNDLASTEWMMLGYYFILRGCVVAVDADFSNKMPVFGQLEKIFSVGEEVIFEYTPLKTLEFSSRFMAYKVEKLSYFEPTTFCLYRRMLDYNIYSPVNVNTGLYI
ncbi:Hypothetical predicted protein, partial [Paramuricea clavata]